MIQLARSVRSAVVALALTSLAALVLAPTARAQDEETQYDQAMARASQLLDQALLEEADYSDAIAAYTEALGHQETFEAYFGRAKAKFYADGLEEESLDDFDAALDLDPRNAEALIERARAYDYLGQVGKARRDLKDVLEDDPDNFVATKAMAGVLYWNDRNVQAVRFIGEALERFPEDVEMRFWRGTAAGLVGRLDVAREELSIVVNDDDYGPSAAAWLGDVELASGNTREALEWLDTALEADDENAYAHYTRARTLSALGRDTEAAEAYAIAVDLDPSYGSMTYDDVYTDVEAAEAYLQTLLGLVIWGSVLGVIGLLVSVLRREPRAPRASRGEQPQYDGQWTELFRIYLQNVVLTVLTLGIYRFWARVRNQRFHYQHTVFAEGRFDYHATGPEKFVGFLKGMAILAPVFIGAWFLDEWVTEQYGYEFSGMAFAYGFAFALFLLRPLILVGAQRFNLARTSWNNLRFRFTGRVGEAYKLYLRDLVLLILTFGLYWPWHSCRVREFKMRHTGMGESRFSFNGQGGEFFSIAIFGTMLSYITLGLYLPWYIAARRRFFVNHTSFDRNRLRSRVTGTDVLAIAGPGFLVSVLTLGLGLPWAITRWRELMVATTSTTGPIEADQLASIRDTAASSTIEGLGEAGDALGEIGDLFGI